MRKLFFIMSVFLGAALFGEGTSASDEESYRTVCQKAAEDETYFSQFKSIQAYRQILEHLGRDHGQLYLDAIRMQTPEFLTMIEKFKVNDLYGNPHVDVFERVGAISSTTLRYMKVASDLQSAYGSSLNQKSIVEIGGGYGGQCLILSLLYQFKDYTIVDLPEALALTKKYLEKHHIYNVIYKRMDEEIQNGDYDLLISNYAYCECTSEMRQKYLREIVSRSKCGYMTGFKHTTIEFMDDYQIPYEIWSEYPCTAPLNVLVTWTQKDR